MSSHGLSGRTGEHVIAPPERAYATGSSLDAAQRAAADAVRRLGGPLFDALSYAGAAISVSDPRLPDNPIVYVNTAFCALTGYQPDEVLGRNCRFLQGSETDPQLTARMAAAIEQGHPVVAELVNHRKDGTAFLTRLSLTPLQDEGGRLAFFLGTRTELAAAPHGGSMPDAGRPSLRWLDGVDERLQHVLAVSGAAATWEWHIAERRVVGDAGFARLYNLGRDEAANGVPSQIFFSIIHPQDRDRVRLAIGAMLRGAEVLSKDFRVLAPDGAIRWIDARGRCHYDEADQPTGFSGVLVDITEQKRLEEQLRIAQTAGGVGTFAHIAGFATASVSAQFCHLLGLRPAADLPVRTINAVVQPGDPPIIDTARRSGPKALEAGAANLVEFRIVRPDTGEVRWLTRRGEHLGDADTAEARFSGVVYDITEAKRIETELRTLNETLESRVAERTRERDRIWRVSQDLLGVADDEGRWLSINPAWQAVLGWSEAEIVQRTSAWLEHPDDHAANRAEAMRLAAGRKTLGFENRLRHRDGHYRWLSWTAVTEEGLYYCVGRDVTAEKQSAEALRQTEEKLRQSQKMEAVGQLTGGLAHDFNNLLTGIMGSLDLMRLRVSQGRLADVDRYVTAAQGAAMRAASLTHRLLAFSRRQTLDARPTDVDRLVSGMAELIHGTMGPGITVTVVVGGHGGWHTLVDPNQLENALLNLCINARDAMPSGGRLTIETGESVFDAAAAAEHDLPPGEYVSLCVKDTGTGMTPDVIARAFDPFFTTKPLGQGTGLGLSMIYGFARQSGGEVSISSQIGRGTDVCIWLPRHTGGAGEADLRAGVAAAAAAAPGAVPGETILVVDDEAMVRMFVTDVLANLGYATLEAADGREGLAILRSAAKVDLLVTDVGLPGGINGRQVADAARVLRPGLKVLFITGYAENTVLNVSEMPPGMHVLSKPFETAALTSRIRDIIAAPLPAGSVGNDTGA